MNRALSVALIAGIVAGWGMQRIHARPAQGEAGPAEVPFEHVIIDSHAPLNQWAIGVGDINGDGYVDVVTSGSTVGKGGLYWYEYSGWAKHVIDATGGFSDDLQVVDVDKDGDLDIVVPEDGSKEVRWYENPGPGGNPATDPWKMHVIGSYAKFGFHEAHDVEVADLNGDGRVDVVIANQKWSTPRPVEASRKLPSFFQNSPDSWTPVVVSKTYGEGTCIADLNGDGRPDIVKGGWWLENPKDPVHDKWPQHWFYKGWPDRAGVTVADINQDGRPDVVLSAAELPGRMSWFEAPSDAVHGKWVEQVISKHVDYAHTFKVADINNDGLPDIVFAEMQQSKEKRVGFFLNEGKGKSWKLQVVAITGSHNIRVADVDRDGDIDIIGANWNTEDDPNHAPMEMWRNLLMDRRNNHHH